MAKIKSQMVEYEMQWRRSSIELLWGCEVSIGKVR